MGLKTCRSCGQHTGVRHGLCELCHAERKLPHDRPPDDPALTVGDQLRDQPWTLRSAFTGRKRRSPRV
jgi:hypothetical protein